MKNQASAGSVGRPNLAAVAALAGVSPSTASLAFSGAGPVSEATKAKVFAAAESLGYAGPDPRAQSLRRGRSGVVGVVIEDRLRDAFRDPMNIAMLDGISDEVGSAGAALLLLTDTGSGDAPVASAPMDAAILIGCSTRLDASVAVLGQRGLPVVAIEADDLPGVLAIGLDNRDATARLCRHLQELGHRSVAVVTLPLRSTKVQEHIPADWDVLSESHTTRERLRGVADVFPGFTGMVAVDSSIDAGRAAALEILAAPDRPTAVVAQSDLLAAGVIRAAEELGLTVPGDLSVVGFDGIRRDEAGGYDLTTMVQPAVEKGQAAGRAVMQLLAGEHPEPLDFVSEFRPGSTTGAPAASGVSIQPIPR